MVVQQVKSPLTFFIAQFIGIKAKRRISRRRYQENKVGKNSKLWKRLYGYSLNMVTHCDITNLKRSSRSPS